MPSKRYRVLRKLAQGGMAEVFLASDERLAGAHRLVVIKRIHPTLLGDEDAAAMFRHEARIATQMSHPNIGHAIEARLGEHGEHYYLVMEFIHGADVRQILRKGPPHMPPALAVHVAAQVAAGLSYAHRMTDVEGRPLNLVHRDVSPANVRISHQGAVKLIDFGVARAAIGSYFSQGLSIKGKFSYMSPEQISARPVDPRTDIFALGIVLFEMLTYRQLFGRKDPGDTLQAILSGDVPPPSRVARWPLPAGVDGVVLRALAREPERRYESARELQRALEQILRQAPASTSDLEEFMTAHFGDGRQRLTELTAPEEPDGEVTRAAIPSLKTLESPVDEPGATAGFDDEESESTVMGYLPLNEDDDPAR